MKWIALSNRWTTGAWSVILKFARMYTNIAKCRSESDPVPAHHNANPWEIHQLYSGSTTGNVAKSRATYLEFHQGPSLWNQTNQWKILRIKECQFFEKGEMGRGSKSTVKNVKHLLVQKCYSYKIVHRKVTHMDCWKSCKQAEVPELKEYKHSYNPEKRLVMLPAFACVIHTRSTLFKHWIYREAVKTKRLH